MIKAFVFLLRLFKTIIILFFKDFQRQFPSLSSYFVYFSLKGLQLNYFPFKFSFVGFYQKNREYSSLLFIIKQDKCQTCCLNTNVFSKTWRVLSESRQKAIKLEMPLSHVSVCQTIKALPTVDN